MSRKTKIIVAIITGIIVVGGIMVWLLSQKDPSTIETTDKQVSENRLVITNFSTYSTGITDDQHYNLEKAIYKMIGKSASFKGEIRPSSYKKEQVNGYTNVEFLVDIASIKRTYRAFLTIAGPDDFRVVQVSCPSEQDLIYEAFECKDFTDA